MRKKEIVGESESMREKKSTREKDVRRRERRHER